MQAIAAEQVMVDTPTVACDGGVGALGHPRVFLTLADHDSVTCPYCGKIYVFSAANGSSAHH